MACSAILAAAFVAASAPAAVTGVYWTQVDNSIGSPQNDAFAGAQWSALTRVTFDLFLIGDPGERIRGINMGDPSDPAGSPFVIRTDGMVFNHPLGSDVRTNLEFPPFNAMAFDTFVDLGGGVATPVISFVEPADLNANGTTEQEIRGRWFTDDEAVLDDTGLMRILRVTVGYDLTEPFTQHPFLGTPEDCSGTMGEMESWIQVELWGGELVSLQVFDALPCIPSPGASALPGIAGVAGLRRRRN